MFQMQQDTQNRTVLQSKDGDLLKNDFVCRFYIVIIEEPEGFGLMKPFGQSLQ